MGRNISTQGEVYHNHPLLYLSFLIASIAATFAIVSSLCGSLIRKKSHSPPPSSSPRDNDANVNPIESFPAKDEQVSVRVDDSSDQLQLQRGESLQPQQPLPPPPAMMAASSHHLRASSMVPPRHSRSNSSTSQQGKLGTSMSMRVFGNSRQASRREDEKKKDKKLDHEDSIWKKQIILGEKCKVSDEDDDTILYDENGNRISSYHPKLPSALTMSRQSSNVDDDAIPK